MIKGRILKFMIFNERLKIISPVIWRYCRLLPSTQMTSIENYDITKSKFELVVFELLIFVYLGLYV